MHVDDDTPLIGGNYISTTPASSIFCANFLNKSQFSLSDSDNNTTTILFYFWLKAPGKDLEHAQNAK